MPPETSQFHSVVFSGLHITSLLGKSLCLETLLRAYVVLGSQFEKSGSKTQYQAKVLFHLNRFAW